MNKYNVIIATSAYQLINVLNLQITFKNSILCIVDSFAGAFELFQKLKNMEKFKFIHFFSTEIDAYRWVISEKDSFKLLFIDSDINKKKLMFILRKLTIFVYEEGVGTYSKKHYYPSRPFVGNFRLMLLNIFGYKNRRGGDRYVKGLVVYRDDFYKKFICNKKTILTFNKPFLTHLLSDDLKRIFCTNLDFKSLKNLNVAIYIGSWIANHKKVNNILSSLRIDHKIYKPHPHTSNGIECDGYDDVVLSNYPAELLIYNVLMFAKDVIVISEYSTSMVYFESYKNIKHIKLDINNKDYVQTYNSLVKDVNVK